MIQTGRWSSSIVAASIAGVVMLHPVTRAQAPATPALVSALLVQPDAFPQQALTQLELGQVIAQTKTAPENLEASVMAAVRIATTKDRVIDYFRQLVSYVDGQVTMQFGKFGQSPSESDIQSLVLDPADIGDLRACQPASCEIRIG